jgi:hypothetical protein
MPSKHRRPRYVVREVEGALGMGGGTHVTGGLSVSVHDAWNGYRTRAVCRSEDYTGPVPRERRKIMARAHARVMADTLEKWQGS